MLLVTPQMVSMNPLERINWNAVCGLFITCHNISRNIHKAYGGATALIRVWSNIVWPPHAKCDKHDVGRKCWVNLAKVSYILSLIIIVLWLHLHDLSFDCPENDGLIKASLKNQTTLINHRKGSKANPPRKCVDGIKENTTIAHNNEQVIQILKTRRIYNI